MQLYHGLTKKAQLWIAFLFILLFLVVSSYASLIYSQYRIEHQIAQFREENDRITTDNRDKWISLVRLSLSRVVEKENKANMNRVRPGEKVIVISDDETKNFVLKEQKTALNAPASAGLNSPGSAYPDTRNPRKWWYFFFPPKGLIAPVIPVQAVPSPASTNTQ